MNHFFGPKVPKNKLKVCTKNLLKGFFVVCVKIDLGVLYTIWFTTHSPNVCPIHAFYKKHVNNTIFGKPLALVAKQLTLIA